MELENVSIHRWIQKHEMKNEKGEPIDFRDHLFLFDIYRDWSPLLVGLKAAQVGWSTLEVLRLFWKLSNTKMDCIYTLPSDSDVNTFVGGKVNRIIANNPVLVDLVKDKDAVGQKQVGESMVYFRGTWTQRASIMVTSDWNCHDELDSSKQDVVSDYQARLQHSQFKWRHYFSHPSVEGVGVDTYWNQSDQKHWFVKCPVGHEQYLRWPESIDMVKRQYICLECGAEITDRRRGRWIAKYQRSEERPFSGYWIPLLIAPWVSAGEIIDKFNDKTSTEEFFYNKVLGLPYASPDSRITENTIFQNLVTATNSQTRTVIGCDSGLIKHYVMGNREGLFYYGKTESWDDIAKLLQDRPDAILVVDHLPDLTGPRALRERFPGRVFLCHYSQDRKTMQLVRFGKLQEEGNVIVDRNRMITMVINELKERRIPIQGTKEDWYDFYVHFSNIYKTEKLNSLGIPQVTWEKKNSEDHWVHSLVYWRAGMSRYGMGEGTVVGNNIGWNFPSAPVIGASQTMNAGSTNKFVMPKADEDWRNVI